MVSDCTRERLGAQIGVFSEQEMESLMRTFGRLVVAGIVVFAVFQACGPASRLRPLALLGSEARNHTGSIHVEHGEGLPGRNCACVCIGAGGLAAEGAVERVGLLPCGIWHPRNLAVRGGSNQQ
jgi:hypothetical protein